MRSFTLASATTRHFFGACPQGLQRQRLTHSIQVAKFTTRARGGRFSAVNRRNVLLIAVTGAFVIGTTLAFLDDIKHGYAAVQRSGRVAATLGLCINE